MSSKATFISYSRSDSEFVLKLANDLRSNGTAIWLDQLDIKPGMRWDNAIRDGLVQSEKLVVVLSPTSVVSENVMDEVSYALGEGRKVIPVLLKECEVPFRWKRLQRIDFTSDYDRGINLLLEAIGPIHSSQAAGKLEYFNFDLKVKAGDTGQYSVELTDSPAGRMKTTVFSPLSEPGLNQELLDIEKIRRTKTTRKSSPASTTQKIDEVEVEKEKALVHSIGSRLFECLFSSELQNRFRKSLLNARKERRGLRLRLQFEAPELSSLPWEYLYDASEDEYLGLTNETPIVRFAEIDRPIEALTVIPPLNILGMVASPSDLPTLDIEREKDQMAQAVEHLIEKGLVQLTWVEGQSWRDLQTILRKGRWNMLHFIGHGGFDKEKNEGYISMVGEDGNAHRLFAAELGRLMAGHHPMRVVVLNSCEGGNASDEDLYSSIGAHLIRKGIPAVVSMQHEISNQAAMEFSQTFYETIAEGLPIDAALQEARKSMSLAMRGTHEWGTPLLHMLAPDGVLFHLDITQAIFDKVPDEGQEGRPEGPAVATDQDEVLTVSREEQRGLHILFDKVRSYWIEGVLNQSLRDSDLIEMGIDNMPELVDSPWGSFPVSTDHSIENVFDETGRSMLILGEPGAGKTTLMLTLAKALLANYDEAQNMSLPVVFNLSSWSDSHDDLETWLSDELSKKYMIPRAIGKSWVNNRLILCLLDGLDEVKSELRNDCVRAINSFIQSSSVRGAVVCCRFKEYLEMDKKLLMNAAIRLRLLPKEQILRYVRSAGASYSALHQLLQSDPSFLRLAETPFMLSLMMRTYRGTDIDLQVERAGQSLLAKQKQLMDAYINRQFRMMKDLES